MKRSFLRQFLGFLVLIILLEIFIISFIAVATIEEFHRIAVEQHEKLEKNAEELVKEVNKVYDFVARDYSWWDEMVDFTITEDQGWARDNIALEALLSQYRVDGIIVVNSKGKVIFQDGKVAKGTNVGKYIESLDFKKPQFKTFYEILGEDVALVLIAPIQPAYDVERKTVPRGYLIIQKVLDSHYLEKLSLFSNSKVQIKYVKPERRLGSYCIPLKGLNGNPAAYMIFERKEQLTVIGKRLLVKLSVATLSVSLVFGLVLFWYVYFKVLRPLKDMEKSLSEWNAGLLGGYAKRRDELGDVAGAVVKSIEYLKTDPLTGLRTRHDMESIIARYIERSGDSKFSIIITDIDDFKKINDLHGHNVGDEALRDFGQVIKENLRISDLAFRYGGEEFVIVLPGAEAHEAGECAERIRKKFRDFELKKGINVSASFGVTEYKPQDTAEDLLKRADVALYKAKRNGKNRIEVIKE